MYKRQVQKAEHILQNANEDDNYAILFFNIKNFKAVNELFGIDLGDFILREFYEDLKNSQLDPVVIARAEADHFVCLVKRENLDEEDFQLRKDHPSVQPLRYFLCKR